MPAQSFQIEVQSDFLEKVTKAKPIHAIAELIWNSLDADADNVVVHVHRNELGGLEKITIFDNGIGIVYDEAPLLFQKLGGSWKEPGGTTANGRFLHGQEGRGRLKAFTLGGVVEWFIRFKEGDTLYSYRISMDLENLREVSISDKTPIESSIGTGVTVTIWNLHKDFRSLSSEEALQELTEIFALYLTNYEAVSISVQGQRLDPNHIILSRFQTPLNNIIDDNGTEHSVVLDIIEWHKVTNRALYLCNQHGFPLSEIERRFHVGAFQFSAYLKSSFFESLVREGTLDIAELRPEVRDLSDSAYHAIKTYFRERTALESQGLVTQWKDSSIYPFTGEASTTIDKVERQVFDIVAVQVAHFLPQFSESPTKNQAFHLRLLKQAIEKSPDELQLILSEVLNLPLRQQEELAELLKDVKLPAIISASKLVTDRLSFLRGLEAILFENEYKKLLKERAQLHQIIKQNCWLFGEEYSLSVDDQSLTEVLRKHKKVIGDTTIIDQPVKHVTQKTGIVDLMFSRAIKRHKASNPTHLVVELKAPKVKISQKEIVQIEQYALSVKGDERFRAGEPTWIFWVISDDFDDYASYRMKKNNGVSTGLISDDPCMEIYIKTWGEVIDDNRARLQFFQEKIEFEADKGASLQMLQDKYADFLKGVLVEDDCEVDD